VETRSEKGRWDRHRHCRRAAMDGNVALLSGPRSLDIGMASRKIKPEELRELQPLFWVITNAGEHVLALDGIAVIVRPANSVAPRPGWRTTDSTDFTAAAE
jgi:hypothetical protein